MALKCKQCRVKPSWLRGATAVIRWCLLQGGDDKCLKTKQPYREINLANGLMDSFVGMWQNERTHSGLGNDVGTALSSHFDKSVRERARALAALQVHRGSWQDGTFLHKSAGLLSIVVVSVLLLHSPPLRGNQSCPRWVSAEKLFEHLAEALREKARRRELINSTLLFCYRWEKGNMKTNHS